MASGSSYPLLVTCDGLLFLVVGEVAGMFANIVCAGSLYAAAFRSV